MSNQLTDDELLQRLRNLVGNQFQFAGKRCVLMEVLTDEAQLVLCCRDASRPIQANQYGQPCRRAAESILIPVFGQDSDSLSADLLELLQHKMDASAE